MRAIKPYVAVWTAGAVVMHSMVPTFAAIVGETKAVQCDVRIYAAGLHQSDDCSGGSVPPKAAAALTITGSTGSITPAAGMTFDFRTDAITDIDYPASAGFRIVWCST
jgi:hypothetical protein